MDFFFFCFVFLFPLFSHCSHSTLVDPLGFKRILSASMCVIGMSCRGKNQKGTRGSEGDRGEVAGLHHVTLPAVAVCWWEKTERWGGG